jgi:DNA-binding FrmR family transcriptional regulator
METHRRAEGQRATFDSVVDLWENSAQSSCPERFDGGTRMAPKTEDVEDVLVRLRRIEGQVRGLQRMIEERRSCEDVITQVIAVRAALDKVGILALQNHIDECVSGSPEEASDRLRRATELLLKLSR